MTSTSTMKVEQSTIETTSIEGSKEDSSSDTIDKSRTSLTRQETWNILCLVLAFCCVFASLTLIVGTGAVVITSVGGDTTLTAFPLAVFFLGMGSVSLLVTHRIFDLWGRKKGFWFGSFLILLGVTIAIFGCLNASPGLILVANVFLGAGTGIGMYVRFAAVEVAPPEYASRSIAWVLCGGCLAAFAGPEAAEATTGVFADEDEEHLTYLGVFVIAGCFSIAQAVFVGLVSFPSNSSSSTTGGDVSVRKEDACAESTSICSNEEHEKNADIEESSYANSEIEEEIVEKQQTEIIQNSTNGDRLCDVIRRPEFYIPVIVSALSWSIMAMPMSIFRITMRDLGYTDRQSLTVIECHFFSMYFPGFFSGLFIKKYGVVQACKMSIFFFLLAFAFNMSAQDTNDAIWSWFLGLIIAGFGWNFGFTSSTVWVTKAYEAAPHLKAKVQGMNEGLVFFLAGSLIFSAGFLYSGDLGGGGIQGWRFLNYVILGLIIVFGATIFAYERWGAKKVDSAESEPAETGKSSELVEEQVN